MKVFPIALISLFLLQDAIPFKSNEEFELKLDLQFKQRPNVSSTTIELGKRSTSSAGMHAPYLYLHLRVVQPHPEEVRIKVIDNKGGSLLSRKFDPTIVVKLDLGFVDDIKDRATAHQYFVTFLSKEKTPISQIEIFFEEDGTYLVNGEKRGKL